MGKKEKVELYLDDVMMIISIKAKKNTIYVTSIREHTWEDREQKA